MKEQVDNNFSWLYPTNLNKLLLLLTIVLLCYILIDYPLDMISHNLKDTKFMSSLNYIKNLFSTIFSGILVSLIFSYTQYKMHENELENMQNKIEKNYKNVLAAAELLQNSRKNNGLSGITDHLEEQKIFEKLTTSNFTKDSTPTIWWHNFRIEQYDTFKKSIEDFVKRGGNVYLVTTHPYNPNIEFRLKEAYPDKDLDDYRQHFFLQATTFIQLEEQLNNEKEVGTFKVYFNKEGTPGIPIFIISQDLDFRAYTGFYLNEISGASPYIIWETAGRGMVKKFKDYVEYKMQNSLSSQEMKNELLHTDKLLVNE